MHEPEVVSLFSGIGGMDRGLSLAGFRHVLLCESDPWRREVLAARFPGVPIADDVREVAQGGELQRRGQVGGVGDSSDAERDGLALPVEPVAASDERERGALLRPDLVAGGSPCQDLSVAGNRAGIHGERSGLFFEYARVVEALQPRWFLFENVPGLLSSNGGRDFGVVLGTLADLGYGVAWRVLDSRFFGVPQRRRRVFVVGARADGDPRAAAERAAEVLAVGSRCERHPATRGETGPDVAGALVGRSPSRLDDAAVGGGQLVAHSLTSAGHDASEDGTGRGTPIVAFHPTGGGAKDLSPTDDLAPGTGTGTGTGTGGTVAIAEGGTVRRLLPVECERLQGLPDGWTLIPDTAPDSRRYSALGDSVTASVAQWIGERIMQHVRSVAA